MVLMLKQAHSRSNLRVRDLAAMVKARPSRPRPLTLRSHPRWLALTNTYEEAFS